MTTATATTRTLSVEDQAAIQAILEFNEIAPSFHSSYFQMVTGPRFKPNHELAALIGTRGKYRDACYDIIDHFAAENAYLFPCQEIPRSGAEGCSVTRHESRNLFAWIAGSHGTPVAFLAMGKLRQCVKRNADFFAGRDRAQRLRDTAQRILRTMGHELAA
jgi:hypothetical protein